MSHSSQYQVIIFLDHWANENWRR